MKLHGWEAYFQKRVEAVRAKQTDIMGKRSVYDALNDVVWQSTTFVVRKPWFERCVYLAADHVSSQTTCRIGVYVATD